MPSWSPSSLIWPRNNRTPLTTAAEPLNAEKTITSRTGTPRTNVPMAKIAPTMRPMITMIGPVLMLK